MAGPGSSSLLPVRPKRQGTRLSAARSTSPDGWLGCDAAWVFRSAAEAVPFANVSHDLGLGWLEDIFPPGDVDSLLELRTLSPVPLAMGNEQGGSYYPQALIDLNAVDVVRIDLTYMGGISGGRSIVDRCVRAVMTFAPHMFAHVHSQVFSAWGFPDVPIEWGVQWTGVDPYADSLAQPLIVNGRMAPLESLASFGSLVNLDWIGTQECIDPDDLFAISR